MRLSLWHCLLGLPVHGRGTAGVFATLCQKCPMSPQPAPMHTQMRPTHHMLPHLTHYQHLPFTEWAGVDTICLTAGFSSMSRVVPRALGPRSGSGGAVYAEVASALFTLVTLARPRLPEFDAQVCLRARVSERVQCVSTASKGPVTYVCVEGRRGHSPGSGASMHAFRGWC